ncbi:MAG: PhoH family protein [Armatimonadetes bacterium]|nr:PhoH family protein [Armatimonadota bacterium]
MSRATRTKVFLLDTSVLLHRPEAIFSFGEHDVVIPIVVLDELDNFKKGSMEINRNARQVIKLFDELREQGPVSQGIKLDTGGSLKVDVDYIRTASQQMPPGFGNNVDNLILATAVGIKKDNPKRKVVLVTKDINMRVKAEALGLLAEDYRADQIVQISDMYTGHSELRVTHDTISEVYENKEIPIESLRLNGELGAHQFLMLTSEESSSVTALTQYDSAKKTLRLLRELREIWSIRPLNREQRYAFEVLLDDSVPLVTLAGKAGTGKTILAIAAGLQKVVNEKVYRRLAIYRPVIPMGRDIGYLPGSEQDKLSPWMQPIFDNLEFLLNEQSGGKKGNGRMDYLLDSNLLDIRALTYIRGRSLPQQYIIVDEAQNLTPHEVKTIITRAGHGTKLILTGDPYQIDHPYLDSISNGLTHVVEKFRGQTMAAHVTLVKGERSPLAELASTLMEH